MDGKIICFRVLSGRGTADCCTLQVRTVHFTCGNWATGRSKAKIRLSSRCPTSRKSTPSPNPNTTNWSSKINTGNATKTRSSKRKKCKYLNLPKSANNSKPSSKKTTNISKCNVSIATNSPSTSSLNNAYGNKDNNSAKKLFNKAKRKSLFTKSKPKNSKTSPGIVWMSTSVPSMDSKTTTLSTTTKSEKYPLKKNAKSNSFSISEQPKNDKKKNAPTKSMTSKTTTTKILSTVDSLLPSS